MPAGAGTLVRAPPDAPPSSKAFRRWGGGPWSGPPGASCVVAVEDPVGTGCVGVVVIRGSQAAVALLWSQTVPTGEVEVVDGRLAAVPVEVAPPLDQ